MLPKSKTLRVMGITLGVSLAAAFIWYGPLHIYYNLREESDFVSAEHSYKLGDYSRAVAKWQDDLDVIPLVDYSDRWTAKVHKRLGDSYRKLGKFDQAIEQYQKSLRLDTTPDAKDGLKLAQTHIGS